MTRARTRAPEPRWTFAVKALIGAASVAAMAGFGCSSDSGDGGGSGTGTNGQCLTERDYFAKKVWAPVMAKVCIKCHSPDGVATEENAKLLLLPPSYPGFMDANLDSARLIAKTEFEGKSELLRKPLGEMDHGGGKVIEEGSAEYKALQGFVEKLAAADNCTGAASVADFGDVTFLDPLETLRKASLQLVGRLPTPAEVQALLDQGDAGLEPLLDKMMTEDAFFDRVKEMYNDQFLTDRYLGYNGYAVDILNDTQYPNSGDSYDNLSDDEKKKINLAVAREPLQLVAYIVKNDRPFTEILTAPYTVMNPYSAKIFNAKLQFDDPTNENEWKEGQIIAMGDTSKGEPAEMPLPTSGLLTSPVWLNRFPTTPTNVNRHRARMVFKFFLATDILKIAERPIDPTQATNYANPTREDNSCNVCHRMIDPIAGAFQKFDDNDQEKYEPNNSWHPEMFPPGFGKEVMQTNDYDNALGWLAQRIVQDPRFTLSVVYTAFTELTGQEPLAYPPDSDAPGFEHDLAAWEAQDALFRKIGDAFVASNFNLKTVFKGVILSPYFRAKNATGEVSPERALELSAVGTGRLSIPEVLGRKITAVTGLPWGKGSGYYKTDYLSSDYRILYGGMDSDDVTQRLTVPNGIMANVAWRMADEVACQTTAWDLSIDKPSDRYLFPYVNVEDTPDSNPDAIKKNIQYLHAQILGEALDLGDPEVSRTYQLFEETWKEGQAKLASKEVNESLVYACRARKNPYTDQDLADGDKLEKDPDYTVRAWMAVVTYLLSDYKFLYE